MKTLYKISLTLCLIVATSTILYAQTIGDYRSNGTGIWSNAGIWQRFNGTNWVGASTPPTGSETITIRSGDSVYINAVVNLTGILKNEGKLGGTSNLTVKSGGLYSHDQNGGSIPVCTWEDGSTCQVTGYVSGSKPNNSNQNFYNFVWDCPGQTQNVDVAWYYNTINGDIMIKNTGTSRLQMTSPGAGSPNTIEIKGNIYVLGGQFSSNGSSSTADIIVNTYGNIYAIGTPGNLSSVNFSISRGSGPNVLWNLYGDSLIIQNATTQNSGGAKCKFVFAKNGEQVLKIENVAYGSTSAAVSFDVASGSILYLGTTELIGALSTTNTGSFRVLSGATIYSAHPGGINGNIQCTGETGGGNFFATDASYGFNGTENQVTGTMMPDVVQDLIIDNPTTVALSKPTTINGVLRLKAGVFDNTIPFTLGPSGSISYEGGSLLVSVNENSTIPNSFYVYQNFPNPFNPVTNIKFDLPYESYVTVKIFDLLGKEISTLFTGKQNAGTHELSFDASNLSSGVYLYRIQTDKNIAVKQMILIK